MAYERVTLYGVPLVAARRINYGRIDPVLARELFLRHALVQGEWRTHHKFFHENRELLEELEELEERARRRDLVVDEETLFAFYDKRVPMSVISTRDFDAWWKSVRREQPDLLSFTAQMLLAQDAGISAVDYPNVWEEADLSLRLTYVFEPGSAADGVTVYVPLPVLNRFRGRGLDWQVPGLRLQLVTALLKSLPKPLRRLLVPVPDTATRVLEGLPPEAYEHPVLDVLARELHRHAGVSVPPDAWDLASVPAHLRVTFSIEDEQAKVLAQGKRLDALRRQLAPEVERRVSAAAAEIEKSGLRDWSFGVLPTTFENDVDSHSVRGFPAIVEETGGGSVAIRVLASSEEQESATWVGIRRLLLLTLPSPLKPVVSRLDLKTKLALAHNPHGSVPTLLEDCVTAVLDELMRERGAPVWDEDGFRRLQREVRPQLPDRTLDLVVLTARVLSVAQELRERINAPASAALEPSLADLREQLSALVYAGFVTTTGTDRIGDLLRYLSAAQHRLEVLPTRVSRDQQLMGQVQQVRQAYEQLRSRLPPPGRADPEVARIRWMIEELRVSLFAQHLRTAYAVSPQRIYRAIEAAGR